MSFNEPSKYSESFSQLYLMFNPTQNVRPTGKSTPYIGDATAFETFKDRLFDIPDATIALVSGTGETLSEFVLGLAKATLKGGQMATTTDPKRVEEIRKEPGFTSYFDQLNSESKVAIEDKNTKKIKGFKWMPKHSKGNHALDCHVYAKCALYYWFYIMAEKLEITDLGDYEDIVWDCLRDPDNIDLLLQAI